MPVYEYQCNNCGKISEFLVGVTQEKLEIRCRYCGSKELNKIFSKSFISKSGHLIASQGGKLARRSLGEGGTCCGREERCDVPPCSENGVCKR